MPAPFGPWSRTTSAGSTSRSTPARAGNRPISDTAPRRWTAGSMGPGEVTGRRGGHPSRHDPGSWSRHHYPAAMAATAQATSGVRPRGPRPRPVRAHLGAPRHRLGRAAARDRGRGAPAARRLPAVGHQPADRPAAGQAADRVRAGARRGRCGAAGSTTTVAEPTTTTTTDDGTTPSTAPTIPPPAIGEVVGRLTIPSIGVRNFYFVEGTGIDQLKRGAAHYPETPLPGPGRQRGHRRATARPGALRSTTSTR